MPNKQIVPKINKFKYAYATFAAFILTYVLLCVLLSNIYNFFNFYPSAGISCLMCLDCKCSSGYPWFVYWPAFISSSLIFSLMVPKQNKYYKLVWGIFCVIIMCYIFYTITHIDFICDIVKANMRYRHM